MNIPESLLVQTNGLVSFIDPTNWLFVPTVPVTDPVATNNLLAMTKKPISSVSIKFEAIDFGALSTQSVLDTNSALAAAASALAASGLTPQFGTPAITHTVFKAVFTNSDKTVSSVSNYLDTRVAYTFCDPAGYPMIGPGAQVQITYGASGNVTRLRYATCQMATGPSVSVITATEASNRIARLFAPGSQIDLRLVYWCPDFLPPTACPGCPPPAWNPTNILPWYVFNVTTLITNPITGIVSTNTSGFQRIPATDDVNFVPSVALSAWGGTSTNVFASAAVSGGSPPYTYSWSGSEPSVSTNSGPYVTYTPRRRIALPPLAVSGLGTTGAVSISWPSPSTGFVLESSTDLAAPAWSQVTSPVQTNSGFNVVSLAATNTQFFRLRLTNQAVPVTESLSLTATDVNGVAVHTNVAVSAYAQIVSGTSLWWTPGQVTYGTESPYDAGGFDDDRIGWQRVMGDPSLHAGKEAFCWTQYASMPGDFMEPSPPGVTGQFIVPTIDEMPPAPGLYAEADILNWGVNTANMVLYLGHGAPGIFTFTWPDFLPLDGTCATTLWLTAPGASMDAEYDLTWTAWHLNLTQSWGNLGGQMIA